MNLFQICSEILQTPIDTISGISWGLALDDWIHIDLLVSHDGRRITEDNYYEKLYNNPQIEKVIESNQIGVYKIIFQQQIGTKLVVFWKLGVSTNEELV